MHKAVLDEKSIFEERRICGSSVRFDSMLIRIIDDLTMRLVSKLVPMLENKNLVENKLFL